MNGSAPSVTARSDVVGESAPRLQGHGLALARAGWLVVTVVVLGLDVLGTQPYFQQTQLACVGDTCLPHQLKPPELRELLEVGRSVPFFAAYEVALTWIGTLVYAALATVLFVKRPDDRMAMFAAYILMLFGAGTVFGTLNALPAVNSPAAPLVGATSTIGPLAFYVFFCLFPSGRFVPRLMGWVSLAWIAGSLVALVPYALLQVLNYGNIAFFVFFLLLLFAQIYRYRKVSTPAQREQTKWVVLGFVAGFGGFIAILLFLSFVPGFGTPSATFGVPFLDTALEMTLWLLPISIAVAIMRSRLWDIDLIINRALVYGSLTAVLAAVYFGCVVAFQALVEALTGQRSLPPPVIVASTLLIAALVNPLRARLQALIDWRFYRRKYDAAAALARFGAVLRTETDLSQLSGRLISVIDETMRPAHVSLWLRSPTNAEAPK